MGLYASSQTDPKDSSIVTADQSFLIDTTIDYTQLFSDFDSFMDSILSPRSYFLVSVTAGKGYYNFETKSTSSFIETSQKLTYTPVLGYYHKTGLGLTGTGYIINDNENLNIYQFSLMPSYDYIQDKRLVTGVAYTRYFTKDSLPFYTTPLQNEIYAYFTYRKTWLRPTISANYGWGSRTDYQKRQLVLQDLRLRRNGYTYVNTKESVSDFSLMASIRHDFYWLDVVANKDHIRFTPLLSFTSGTQKFGFNQSSGTYATVLRTGNNILFSSDNVYLDDKLQFQPLALTLSLRGEYSIGKFFMQPQLILDYYFPADDNNFNTLFAVNAGFIF
jgi:hypothetical protein